MRGDELLDVLEHIDPDLIDQAQAGRSIPWLRRLAGVACLIVAFVLGCFALFLSGQNITDGSTPTVLDMPTVSVTPTVPDVPPAPLELMDLIEHKVYSQPLTGMQVLGSPVSGSAGSSSGTQGEPPAFEYQYNLMVEGKVVEVLPDVYNQPLTAWKFHILRVQTVDDILGQNFPKEFYLRIEKGMSTELSQFDSLIFSLKQVGIDDYLMINQDKGTLETFTLLFDVYSSQHSMYNTALAYSDGVLDPSLWELTGWSLGAYKEKCILENGDNGRVPAKSGCSAEDSKVAIRAVAERSERLQKLRVETKADFPHNAVFEYVAPFQNGIFLQEYDGATRVTYTRLINGLRTNEQIVVQGKTVIRTGEAFTEADLAELPDLCGFIEKLDLDSLEQPNGAYYQDMDVWQQSFGATGLYAKVNGQIYGVVKVTWHYIQNGTCGHVLPDYYDAIYYLVDADGSYRTVTYQELYQLIGGDKFLVVPTPVSELKKHDPFE